MAGKKVSIENGPSVASAASIRARPKWPERVCEVEVMQHHTRLGAEKNSPPRKGGGVVADETRRPASAGAGFLLGNLGAHGIHIQFGHLLQQRVQLPG